MILTSLQRLTSLNLILKYSDAVVAGNDSFSVLNEESFTIDELKEIINITHKAKKLFILKLNCMLHEDKIKGFISFVKQFENIDGYYVSDVGAAIILKEMGYKDKIIFDPTTMICNSMDAQIYYDIAKMGLGVSSEITLNDANIISNSIDNNMFYKIFGYHQMCFSKRKLISLYLKENKITKLGDIYYLKEEKRQDYYPVIEKEYGTIILRSHVINLMKEIYNVSAKYMFVESFLISDDKLNMVLSLYRKLIDKEITIKDAQTEYDKLNILTSDGFTYTDSVYLKEDMKNV